MADGRKKGDRGQERRSRRDPDEDSDDDRPRRRRSRDLEDAPAPASPMVYGILSIVFCWGIIIGLALGGLAISKATAALDELPSGKRGRAARKNLGIAKVLGTVGICLSLVMLIIAIVLNLRSPRS